LDRRGGCYLVGAEDFEGSVTGAAGTGYFEPDGAAFVTGTLRACLILNEPVEKPFSKIDDIGKKRIATMISVGFGWRFSNDGIGSSALPAWWHER
jgi:hypothetical protein